MAYKFQLGEARLSGSLVQEGGVTAENSALSGSSLNVGSANLTAAELETIDGVTAGTAAASKALIVDASRDITNVGNVTSTGNVTAGGSFIIGSADLNETDLEKLDGITNGTAAASKAVVLDASKNIATIGTIGCGAITSTGASSFAGGISPAAADGAALGSAAKEWSDLYLADGGIVYFGNDQDVKLEHVADSGLNLHSVNSGSANATSLIMNFSSSSPADGDEIGKLAFKAFNDNQQNETFGQILMKSTDVSDGSEDGSMEFATFVAGSPTSFININGTAASTVTFADGAFDVDIASHDGTNGLKLEGTLVTSTAAELNKLDGYTGTAANLNFVGGVTAGTQAASKALVCDANGLIEFQDGAISGLFGAGADANALVFGADKNFAMFYDEAQADGLIIAGLQNAEAGVTIIADEGDDASLSLVADQGDDAGDSWALKCADGGVFTIGNDIASQGTSVAHLTITPNSTVANSTAAFAGGVTIAGNLTVNGTTTSVNSSTINITSSFTFEGATPDAHETVFGVTDPTADATINLPAMSAGTYHVPVLAAASTTAISSTPAELNLLDGSAKSTSSITLADADGFIVIDGSTTKQIPASDLKTYIGNTSNLDVALKDDGEDLATGVNYFANLGGAESANLPASPSVGDAVYIKAPGNCSSTNTLTISRQGSHTIDGVNSIVLESPNAAVMCVYVVANTWKVF